MLIPKYIKYSGAALVSDCRSSRRERVLSLVCGFHWTPTVQTSSGHMGLKASMRRAAERGPGKRPWQEFVVVDLRLPGVC